MARGAGALLGIALVLIAGACDPDTPENRHRTDPDPSRSDAARRYGQPRTLGRIDEPAVAEASGIVASRRAADTYWVHNDSGGAPHLYCVRSNGDPCGTVEVAGAGMTDWEDIASGPDGDLFIGDIGDNARARASIVVNRIPEPRIGGPGALRVSETAEGIELTWPRRPHDAETLLVAPSGDLFIVTKDSPALVFAAPPVGGELELVGALRLPGLLSLPTGGDVSPDGRHVILATYGRAFELTLGPGRPFRRIWRAEPRAVGLPLARQREAIAYRSDGQAIVTTSEGVRPPLVERELVSD